MFNCVSGSDLPTVSRQKNSALWQMIVDRQNIMNKCCYFISTFVSPQQPKNILYQLTRIVPCDVTALNIVSKFG